MSLILDSLGQALFIGDTVRAPGFSEYSDLDLVIDDFEDRAIKNMSDPWVLVTRKPLDDRLSLHPTWLVGKHPLERLAETAE